TVRGKGNRQDRLPLPADVGQRIVAYLHDGRPEAAQGRTVFVRAQAPYRALASNAVTTVVACAGRRAGLGVIGAHRLRHSAATASRLLGQFVGYLEAHSADTVTTEHALAWTTQPAGASVHWQAIRLSVVRGFAAYLHGLDPSAEVIPAGQFRAGPCRATPYLFSDAGIGSLITAAAVLRPGLRAATYQTLIGLLAVTGIRVGEAIGLDDTDFDAGRELLVIRNAKYGKHRLVPLLPSAVQALARY